MKRKNLLSTVLFTFSLFALTACGGNKKPLQEGVREELPDPPAVEVAGEKEENRPFAQPSPQLQSQVRLMLSHYLNLKESLVESSAEGASKAAGTLLNSIKKIEEGGKVPEEQKDFYLKRINEMEKFVRFIAENQELEVQRGHFSAISAEMFRLLKAFQANEEPVYRQYCPMAFDDNGGYWLSSSKEILNPYFGEKMLRCGQVTETIGY